MVDAVVVDVAAGLEELAELDALVVGGWLVEGLVLELLRDEDAEAEVVKRLLADVLVEEPATEDDVTTSGIFSPALELTPALLEEAAKVLEAPELDADEVNEA